MINRITDDELNKLPEENKKRILTVREKYGNDDWWNSDDIRVIGYYQLKESILITKFETFHEGLELLLGRSIWTHEFGLNRAQLIADAEKAFALLQSGESTETALAYRQQKIAESMDSLRNFAEKNGKEVTVLWTV